MGRFRDVIAEPARIVLLAALATKWGRRHLFELLPAAV
jgi:hypothetical protein